MNALIGHTGFVGSNLKKQFAFDKFYNSQNIRDIEGKEFDLIVCAGARGTKWKANKNPETDFREIERLIYHLDKVKFKKMVLISTIAVYENPADNPYGRHRLFLETKLRNKHSNVVIVRLPALFGDSLKKNAIYDMINKSYEYLPNSNSYFQYYYLANLWKDITKILDNNLSVMNISPTPVPFSKVLDLFDLQDLDLSSAPQVKENMKTNHASLWNKDGNFIYSIEETLVDLRHFLKGKIKK